MYQCVFALLVRVVIKNKNILKIFTVILLKIAQLIRMRYSKQFETASDYSLHTYYYY